MGLYFFNTSTCKGLVNLKFLTVLLPFIIFLYKFYTEFQTKSKIFFRASTQISFSPVCLWNWEYIQRHKEHNLPFWNQTPEKLVFFLPMGVHILSQNLNIFSCFSFSPNKTLSIKPYIVMIRQKLELTEVLQFGCLLG